MMLKSKKGFTMIELVVVIAVLAILVTLAAITYRGVTQSAQNVSIQVDMKVLDDALAMGEAKDGIGKFIDRTTPSTYIGILTDINGNMFLNHTASAAKTVYEINPSINAYYKKLNKSLTEFVSDENSVVYYKGYLVENPPVASPTGYATVSTGNKVGVTGSGENTVVKIEGNRVVNGGDSAVTATGLCWSKKPGPVMNSAGNAGADTSFTASGVGNAFEAISATLSSNATAGEKCYIRPYAINTQGVSYGTELVILVQ